MVNKYLLLLTLALCPFCSPRFNGYRFTKSEANNLCPDKKNRSIFGQLGCAWRVQWRRCCTVAVIEYTWGRVNRTFRHWSARAPKSNHRVWVIKSSLRLLGLGSSMSGIHWAVNVNIS